MIFYFFICSEQFVTLSDSGEVGETSQAMKNVKQLDVLRDKCLYAVKLGVAEAKYLQVRTRCFLCRKQFEYNILLLVIIGHSNFF